LFCLEDLDDCRAARPRVGESLLFGCEPKKTWNPKTKVIGTAAWFFSRLLLAKANV
jgi:hypothetical protein